MDEEDEEEEDRVVCFLEDTAGCAGDDNDCEGGGRDGAGC